MACLKFIFGLVTIEVVLLDLMLADINTKIQRILKKLPAKPGIYKMLDKEGIVLYVGKAKDLKKRVSSYFRDPSKLTVRISKMISKVEDIAYITVDSELEALILELNLIKELKPKYNILLKDDKNFSYVKVFISEDFPRVKVVRQVEKDDEKYFGPKTSIKKVYKTLEVLKSLLPFRDCDLGIKHVSDNGIGSTVDVYKKTIKYPCLQYHINTCIAPCVGGCTKDSYRFIIDKVCRFLEGDATEILNMLKNDMEVAVRERKFEDAAKIRDKLNAINGILEKQKISDVNESNQDVLGFYVGVGKVFLNLFIIREGRLIDSENFVLDVPDVSDGDIPEVVASFLQDYYEKCSLKPESILLPFLLEEKELISDLIKIKIVAPKRGEKSKLVDMSNKNAENFYKQMLVRWEADKAYDPAKVLIDLEKKLSSPRKIKRIEGYDISHFAGDFVVGAMVVFSGGEPANDHYRHFKIKFAKGADDYASLKEVLDRRLKYVFTPNVEGFVIRKGLKKDQHVIAQMLDKEGMNSKDMIMKDFMVIESKKKIVGCGRLIHSADKDVIASLFVSESLRGKGLGHVLLQALVEKSKAKRIYIGCHPKNAPFYEKFGFRNIREAPLFVKELDKNCTISCDVLSYFVYEKKSDKSFSAEPDLIVIDGGKGQLTSLIPVFFKYKLSIPVVSLDKSGMKIFHLKNGKVIDLDIKSDSQIFYLLQRVTDEAHRFSNRLREELQIKSLTK